MTKLFSKKAAIFLSAAALLAILYAFVWPAMGKVLAAAHLKKVSSQEMQPLIQPVSNVVQGAPPKRTVACYEESYTRTKTQLYCQDANIYPYNPEPLPDSSRSEVVAQAAVLDKTLTKNGWVIDRPQDKIKTVAESIPTEPLEPFHGDGVPFHKNIGTISCNLKVSFSGPTDGVSPGVIIIDQFSCQQNTSYFMLHASSHTNQGFGG